MKRLDMNDPRLTAFALGELEGEEAIEMAKLVENDPVAKKHVEEIRETAAMISNEFQNETPAREDIPLRLLPDEREKIFAAATTSQPWWKKWHLMVPSAGLATLAVAVLTIVYRPEPPSFTQKVGTISESTDYTTDLARDGAGALGAKTAMKIPPSSAAAVESYSEQAVAQAPADFRNSPQADMMEAAPEAAANESAPTDLADASAGAGAPEAPSKLAEAKPTPRMLTSPKISEPAAQGHQFAAKKDVTKSGVFSVFGGGNANEALSQSKSGSDELVGIAEPASGRTGTGAASIGVSGGVGAMGRAGSASGRAGMTSPKQGGALNAPIVLKKGKQVDPGFGGFRYRSNSERINEMNRGNTERYSRIVENQYVHVKDEPLSTFSIDVDTASYANVRRMLNSNQMPPADAVRIEEMLNNFKYDYPQPKDNRPFSVTTEIAQSPFSPKNKIVRIGLKGKEIPDSQRPASNLVFLLDVSGSMDEPDKLPLVQKSMELLVEKMREKDRVAIVVYAGYENIALESTSGANKKKIRDVIEKLGASGSTNGAAGINTAYDIAQKHFIKGGINRVILATDGDFNVGTTSEDELVRLIEQKAKTGVFLSVLGFGSGNVNDSMMVKLAGKGNGNYGYIDSLHEARKLLVEQAGGTLHTIAKDVKIQVEFNPRYVSSYRLIGYEKRMLAKEDFNDDKKDAGEIGSGHTVTALYEVVPVGVETPNARPPVDQLKYQQNNAQAANNSQNSAKSEGSVQSQNTANTQQSAASNAEGIDGELMTVKLRYKKPAGEKSEVFEVPVMNNSRSFEEASTDLKFASAVAGFGMLLRDSEHKGEMTYDRVIELGANNSKVASKLDHNRLELIELARKAKRLSPRSE